MSTITDSKGKTTTQTISGTPGLYVVGPARDRDAYHGDVQGVYVVAGASGAYRWIHDEPRPAKSGPRTNYTAK